MPKISRAGPAWRLNLFLAGFLSSVKFFFLPQDRFLPNCPEARERYLGRRQHFPPHHSSNRISSIRNFPSPSSRLHIPFSYPLIEAKSFSLLFFSPPPSLNPNFVPSVLRFSSCTFQIFVFLTECGGRTSLIDSRCPFPSFSVSGHPSVTFILFCRRRLLSRAQDFPFA